MEKKKLKKLNLGKETISNLTPDEQSALAGGGTTSFNNNCGKTNFTCCGPGSFSLPKSCCNSGCGTCDENGCFNSVTCYYE